ncbi:hypothetical protein [Cyanobium sp. ATX 6F1]|uniref:hypothetical protein n=1 Tax=unclassified Cyanobium TaxID=2627006 RepID=UPI0020CD99AC|nr:hypothetical protein [Cyanobium sp. ATX 6F1]MCP9914906.1 hypothetical protein [Cyanobium sp. ATX 6F1]
MVFDVFKRKGFFLTFDDTAAKQPATVAPVAAEPVKQAPDAKSPAAVVTVITKPAKLTKQDAQQGGPASTAPATAVAAAVPAELADGTVLTTAEAIAAQLAAEQASRPAPSQATFAPANLAPGGALPRRRKRGGANLAPFRAVAASLFRQ